MSFAAGAEAMANLFFLLSALLPLLAQLLRVRMYFGVGGLEMSRLVAQWMISSRREPELNDRARIVRIALRWGAVGGFVLYAVELWNMWGFNTGDWLVVISKLVNTALIAMFFWYLGQVGQLARDRVLGRHAPILCAITGGAGLCAILLPWIAGSSTSGSLRIEHYVVLLLVMSAAAIYAMIVAFRGFRSLSAIAIVARNNWQDRTRGLLAEPVKDSLSP
jgi:hypothetical protein